MADSRNEPLDNDVELPEVPNIPLRPAWQSPKVYGDITDKGTPFERTMSFEGGWGSDTGRQKFTNRGDGKKTSAYGLTSTDPTVKKYLTPADIMQGLPKEKAQKIAQERYSVAFKEIPRLVPNISQQPPQVQEMMADLHYNMGTTGLLKFPSFLKAINTGDYERASNELKYVDGLKKTTKSKYYGQTGRRAKWNVNTLQDLSTMGKAETKKSVFEKIMDWVEPEASAMTVGMFDGGMVDDLNIIGQNDIANLQTVGGQDLEEINKWTEAGDLKGGQSLEDMMKDNTGADVISPGSDEHENWQGEDVISPGADEHKDWQGADLIMPESELMEVKHIDGSPMLPTKEDKRRKKKKEIIEATIEMLESLEGGEEKDGQEDIIIESAKALLQKIDERIDAEYKAEEEPKEEKQRHPSEMSEEEFNVEEGKGMGVTWKNAMKLPDGTILESNNLEHGDMIPDIEEEYDIDAKEMERGWTWKGFPKEQSYIGVPDVEKAGGSFHEAYKNKYGKAQGEGTEPVRQQGMGANLKEGGYSINGESESGLGEQIENEGEVIPVDKIRKYLKTISDTEKDIMDYDKMLEGKTKITRDEVQQYIKDNEIEVQEVVLGDTKQFGLTPEETNELERNYRMGLVSEEEYQSYKEDGVSPKFRQYLTEAPVGENYKEVYLSVPDDKKSFQKHMQQMQQKYGTKFPLADHMSKKIEMSQEDFDRSTKTDETKENYTVSSTHATGDTKADTNRLAHIFMHDATVDGKKMLVVREMQSDWAREGREQGFIKDTPNELPEGFKVLEQDDARFGKTYVVTTPMGTQIARTNATSKEQALKRYFESEQNLQRIPYSPLLKKWQELALKKVLRIASEGGYDGITWSSGEQVADRYNIAKKVSEVMYNEGAKALHAYGHNGEAVLVESNVEPDDIEKHIGKEPAKRLLESDYEKITTPGAEDHKIKRIKGEQLELGGEWAKNLYDKQIPNILKKLTKGKVEGIKVDTESGKWEKGVQVTPDETEQQAILLHKSEGTEPTRQKGMDANFSIADDIKDMRKEIKELQATAKPVDDAIKEIGKISIDEGLDSEFVKELKKVLGQDTSKPLKNKAKRLRKKADYLQGLADGVKDAGGDVDADVPEIIKYISRTSGVETSMSSNDKTLASLEFCTNCPLRQKGKQCPYCYVESSRRIKRGKKILDFIKYDGHIATMPDSVVRLLNRSGGYRVYSFGDYLEEHAGEIDKALEDAKERGLMLKFITKQPDLITRFGKHPNARFQVSTDTMPKFMSEAMTPDEAWEYKQTLPKEVQKKVRIRTVAKNVIEADRAGANKKIDILTLYHGINGDKLIKYMKEERPDMFGDRQEEALKELKKFENLDNKAGNKLHEKYKKKTCCATGICATCETKCAYGDDNE